MKNRILIIIGLLALIFLEAGFGQSATLEKITITRDADAIKFYIHNLTIKGMNEKQVAFGFWLSQDGDWLSDTWIGLEPQLVKFSPAVWEGDNIWFSYTYAEIKKAGDAGKSFWGSFFVQDAKTNKILIQKDIEFSIDNTEITEDTGTQDSIPQISNRVFSDDFSRNFLDDITRYVRFGPSRFKVQNGVLRMEVNANQWHQMELLNIFPCFGSTSQISLKARWAGGDGGSLFIGTDWHYRHSGRKTHFFIDFNANKVIAWNTDGATSQDVAFKKGEWVNIRIERKLDTMKLFVNNQLKITRKLDALSATENTDDEAGYGGYFLETDMRPYLQVIEVDDLKVEGDPSPVEFKAMQQIFNLGKTIDAEPYRFSVIYEKGMETWAKAQIDASIPYICRIAELLGIPPMSRSLGMVASKGRYYDDGAGYNNRGVVYQKANLAYPGALSSHELAHNWYSYYGKKWIMESSADFCYFAFQELTAKRLFTASDFLFNLEKYSSDAYLKGVEGFYLDDEDKAAAFFSGGMPQWDIINKTAWKQRVFFYMLYRILGDDGFRKLHGMAAALEHGMTSQELKSFAEKITAKDLSGLFNGWVFPGKTAYPLKEVFTDSDRDGLSDLDERLFGTNAALVDTDKDGYGDRGEVAAGYNPLDAKSPAPGCILVDGLQADWSRLDTTADAQDAAGSEDVKTLSLLTDTNNRQLYALVVFWNSEKQAVDTASWSYYVTFDIDIDKDANSDYRINLFYNKNNVSNAFQTNGYTGSNWDSTKWTALDTSGISFVYNKEGILEAAFPLDLFGNRKTFRVYMNTGSPAGSDTLDKAPVSPKSNSSLPGFPASVWKPTRQ